MPVQQLMRSLDCDVPDEILEIGDALQYRDFMIVGLLLEREKVLCPLDDNWIYIQEPDVVAGRLQIFNNWSPWMVADASKVWMGLEYFCYETDRLWAKSDEEVTAFATAELERIGILVSRSGSGFYVIRVPKTYPAYFGAIAGSMRSGSIWTVSTIFS